MVALETVAQMWHEVTKGDHVPGRLEKLAERVTKARGEQCADGSLDRSRPARGAVAEAAQEYGEPHGRAVPCHMEEFGEALAVIGLLAVTRSIGDDRPTPTDVDATATTRARSAAG